MPSVTLIVLTWYCMLVVFCVQKAILSGIYVYEMIKKLRLRSERSRRLILV
ncbi:uncharacterized protein BP01DRAFT_384802 [Aspergillus saccharolyticus JOP 1030-1]|uniref:Uncharacterized protein n=1 Tax=Aspergillus saccharolyticus JOP 1030-1 TaxID=1450539 RepID=A0A318Z9K8_9EURO|nr:hypothetical protein BP01DRAFT_384802 [Aspergillus saccharolyticus JOP 1030-1]PYH43107.1 hypothetical protein BP01DRAFT_384802 [Aspergillus saccharolyticus JOP 1030-1]